MEETVTFRVTGPTRAKLLDDAMTYLTIYLGDSDDAANWTIDMDVEAVAWTMDGVTAALWEGRVVATRKRLDR